MKSMGSKRVSFRRVHWVRWAAIVAITGILGVTAALYRVVTLLGQPQCDLDRPVRVEIPPGAGLKRVLNILQNHGIVRRPRLLELLFRWYRTDRRIKAGLYEFRGRLTSWELYSRLLAGQIVTRRLTFVEGWDRFDVAAFLERERIASTEETLAAMKNEKFIRLLQDLDPSVRDLEGFLYPSTYEIREPADLARVFTRLVREFRKRWRPEYHARARELGLSVRAVVTFASLVEKETAKPEERGLVASVFWNRLRRHMPLECDPTVIYAWRLQGRTPVPLLRADLRLPSPYNTYLHQGLPPGPIANPGEASVRAVLYAPETDYLYFVADGNGGHRFARSYREHLSHVRLYRRRKPDSR